MARKIALVGIGKIARDQHIPAINASPDWELAAAVSRHEKADGVPNYTDLSDMLTTHPDIDVISLCLPPVPRFDAAALALNAGRHVMLEKPPGATLSEVHTLADMAAAKGLTLFTTWHSREAEQVAAAKAWLVGKRITRLTVTWRESVRKWHPGQDWVFEPGGMGVFDPGINALSIVTEILPDPIHLREAVLEFPENRDTPIAAQLDFVHPHGGDVTADFDWREEGTDIWDIVVDTDAGNLTLRHGGGTLLIDGEEQPGQGVALGGEYPNLYAKMTKLLATGASDIDLRPMLHVSDALTLGKRKIVAPFDW